MELVEVSHDMDRWLALPYAEMNLTHKYICMCTQR